MPADYEKAKKDPAYFVREFFGVQLTDLQEEMFDKVKEASPQSIVNIHSVMRIPAKYTSFPKEINKCSQCGNDIEIGASGLFGGIPTLCAGCENKARESSEEEV